MQEHDYIIIGGGSAGCCLARRLSDAGSTVLLLEAGGGDKSPLIKTPIAFTRLMYDPKFTNRYRSEPEPHLNNRTLSLPRGRVLGGCSAINGMIYMRGQQQDYDDWAALPGCAGWDFATLLPYFKRSEDFQCGPPDAYHATGGPLHVSQLRPEYPITETYISAAVAAGIPRNDDLNGATQAGIGRVHVNIKDGVRHSAAAAFLPPEVRRRDTLTITLKAQVHRVLLDGGRAVGVAYQDRKGVVHERRARRSVILSAGTYNTPLVLERSGVGDPAILDAIGVPLCHALPGVGANLQDHYQVWCQHHVATPRTMGEDGKLPRLLWSVLRYAVAKQGFLGFSAANIGAFVPGADGGRPIFQIHFTPGGGSMDASGNMVPSKRSAVNSTVTLLRPTARGSVHARSDRLGDDPVIRHNYLSTEHDRQRSIEGFKLLRKIYASEPFASAARGELMPGEGVETDAEILDYWRAEGMSVYHPVGTAKMGSGPDAVVDAALRVHGIAGLRVVDASVMPLLPSGNTHAPVVAIAERAAELILGDGGSA